MSDKSEVCHCGMLMEDHTAWGSCTTPKAMPEVHGSEENNRWVDGLLEDIETPFLRDFISRLYEPPRPPAAID
jgi:hypothetical protein